MALDKIEKQNNADSTYGVAYSGDNGTIQQADTINNYSGDIFIEDQINECKILLENLNPKQALERLKNIKDKRWNSLSNNDLKYKLLAHIAISQLNLADSDAELKEAGNNFIEAYKLNTESEKSISNAIKGYYLIGDQENAINLANEAKIKYPNSPYIAQNIIFINSKNLDCLDPISLVDKAHLNSADVCLAIADFYKNKQDDANYLEWAKKAYDIRVGEGNKYDINISSFYASAILYSIEQEVGLKITKALDEDKKEKVRLSIEILEALWTKIKGTDFKDKRLDIPLNLMFAYDLIGEINSDKQKSIVDEISRFAPNNFEIIRRKSMHLAMDDDWKNSIALAEKLPDDSFPEKNIILSQLYCANNDNDNALIFIDKAINQSNLSSRLRGRAIISKSLIIKFLNGEDGSYNFLQNCLGDKKITKAAYLFAKYNVSKNVEDLINSQKEIADDDDIEIKIDIAKRLCFYGKNQEASILYEDILGDVIDIENNLFRDYLISLINSDQRLKLRNTLSKIPLAKKTSFIFLIEGKLMEAIGALPKAIECYQKSLDLDIANNQALLGKLYTLHKLNRSREIKEILAKISDISKWNTNEKGHLASVQKHYGYHDEALNTVYNNLISSFENISTWEDYLLTIPFLNIKFKSESIDEKSHFTIKDIKSGSEKEYIVENQQLPTGILFKSVKTTDQLFKDFSGKKVGDSVSINNNVVTITGIKNKYTAIYQHLRNDISFHSQQTDKFFSFSYEKPEDILIHIKQESLKKEEATKPIIDIYDNKELCTIGILAKRLGSDPINMLESLEVRKNKAINVCYGTAEELQKITNLLTNNNKDYIIDDTTLYTIFKMNLEEDFINSIGGKIGVTQSSINNINNCIFKNELNLNQEGGFICNDIENDKVIFINNKDRKDAFIEQNNVLKRMLSWIEKNADIIDSIEKEDLNDIQKQAIQLLTDTEKDFLFSAWSSDRVIISNDRSIRDFATLFNTDGVWLQVLLIHLLNEGKISEEKYVESVVYLIRNGYNFTTFNSGILAKLVVPLDQEMPDKFVVVGNQLGYCSTESALGVMLEFFRYIWHDNIFEISKKNKITNYTLNFITRNCCHQEFDKILTLLELEKVKKVFGTFYAHCLENWKKGHFIS